MAARGSEDSEEEAEQLQYKVIILGDGATGKTSIAMRFTEDHFAMQYKQTIGLDFFIKRIVLPGDVTLAHRPSRDDASVVLFWGLLSNCVCVCARARARHAGARGAADLGHWRPDDWRQDDRQLHLRRAGHPHLL